MNTGPHSLCDGLTPDCEGPRPLLSCCWTLHMAQKEQRIRSWEACVLVPLLGPVWYRPPDWALFLACKKMGLDRGP